MARAPVGARLSVCGERVARVPRLARPSPGRRPRIQPQVGEDLADRRPLQDRRDDLKLPGAAAPDNETLFWDRLPMTISFMSLIAAQLVDRVDVRAGLRALVPMLLVGIMSVVYWIVTERQGRGNVVP